MDIKKIKAIIELVQKAQISEFSLKEDLDTITIVYRNPAPESFTPQTNSALVSGGVYFEPAAALGVNSLPTEPLNLEKLLLSTMVGTFYSAPAAGKPPFVQVGQEVKQGDVICIIEAMKVMNQITAEKSGKIVEVLVENGQPVEFAQPLFRIE